MALRWYLAPIIGDGTRGNPRRPVIRDLLPLLPIPRSYAMMKSHTKADGWALCEVRAPSFPAEFDRDNRIALLCDASELRDAPSLRLERALEQFGMNRMVADTTVRAVLIRLGLRLQPSFSDAVIDRVAARG